MKIVSYLVRGLIAFISQKVYIMYNVLIYIDIIMFLFRGRLAVNGQNENDTKNIS